MASQDLRERTKAFGLRVIKLTQALPTNRVTDVIARQLLRSGTSVGCNYRSAQRERSNRDFIHKMGIVEEEADESVYWLETLADAGLIKRQRIADLMNEGSELTAIAVASIRTAKRRG